jgi:anti-sigma factor RsiW
MRVLPHPLVCQEAVDLVSDYLDGSLSRRARRRLEKHLAGCDACGAYVEQIRVTIAASGLAGPDDLTPEALETLTELFRRFKDDE